MTNSIDSDDTAALLAKVADGDSDALDRLLRYHRPYLKRVVQVRMEPALKARVDESDVVQEAQIVIARRINDFARHRPTSFRLWARRKVLDQLIEQQRRHIGAEKRSILNEQHISNVSSMAIARKLFSNTPSKILSQIELREQVYRLIEQLGEKHREMLILRHAEELSNKEVAELLGIDPNTARQRYGRAVRQLHQRFAELGMSMDGTRG